MKVQEIMANDPVCCAPNTSLQEVAALMADRHYGEIPVCESGSKKPIGVITDRDITCRVVAKGRNPSELTVREFMTSPCITVTAESDVDECCRLMEETHDQAIACGRCKRQPPGHRVTGGCCPQRRQTQHVAFGQGCLPTL